METASIAVEGNVDATPHLRSKPVEDAVSVVASVPGVRERMVEQQREVARDGKVVMVGRDIGTVVAQEALVKIYLHASDEVRAARRAEQMRASGRSVTDAEVLADLQRRDAIDQSRATAPLRRAVGAEDVDTSHDDLETAIQRVLAIVRRRLGESAAAAGRPA